jgi:hypothetical protein
MNKILSNEKFWLILLALLVLPFLLLCIFIHPSADDYILTADTWRDGIFGHSVKVYFEWSGRYFATFIFSLNPLVFGWYTGYKLLPIFLLALFYYGIYYLIKNILNNETSAVRQHLISLIIFLVFLNNIPSPSECIYWMSASLTYFLPSALMLILSGLIIKSTYSEEHKSKNIVLIVLLSIIITGSNEVHMILLFIASSLLCVYSLITKKKIKKVHLIFWITVLLATLIVICAPGNYSRMSLFKGNADIIFSFKLSILAFIKISVKLIQDPAFIIVTMVMIACLPGLRKNKRFLDIIKLSPFYTFPISIIIIFCFYFVVTYSTGLNPALRIHNTVMLIFIFLWFFNIAILHNYLLSKNKIMLIEVPPTLINLIAVGAFILTITQFSKVPGKEIVCEGDIFRAGYDLIFNAPAYNQEMNERNKLIEHAIKEGRRYIEVPPIKTKPLSIFFIDITKETDNWINYSASEYFGLDSIKLKK